MKPPSRPRIGVSAFLLAILWIASAAQGQIPCFDANGIITPCEGAGGLRYNGTRTQPYYIRASDLPAAGVPQNFFTAPGFLFEPESPYASLKTVPTWNELEQLLDNPYAMTQDLVTPGNFDGYPSYKTTIVRRPNITAGKSLLNPGPPLQPFLTHPLNFNPTTGEEMRLINKYYKGEQNTWPAGRKWLVPDKLIQPFPVSQPNLWEWTYKTITVSLGSSRVFDSAIDYNGPIAPDPSLCVNNLELVPPEGTTLCGRDPGEPGYLGFGMLGVDTTQRSKQYSTPALMGGPTAPDLIVATTARLFDATRSPNVIQARNLGNGAGGLQKPSVRIPPWGNTQSPGYKKNTNPDNVAPSSENDYYHKGTGTIPTATAGPIPVGRKTAAALGKAFFWDMQVGSDGVQSCGTCHFNGTGTDTRTRNQVNPNHLGGDLTFQLHGGAAPNTYDVTAADFPFHDVFDIDQAGDPACTTPIIANVTNVALDHPVAGNITVCDKFNVKHDHNDVMSSMGVVFDKFTDIAPIGQFQPASAGHPAAVMPDLRTAGGNEIDPIPGFQGLRRVEPRNTPTMQAAGFNFDNFWDGRARHDFNGGSVFGAADPQKHVWANDGTETGALTATRQIIRFASIASLATGPGLSEFEMSFLGRNWAKIGKKLLQPGVVPLANQIVDPTDSVLGPFSGQRTKYNGPVNRPGRPGLNVSYEELIKASFYPQLYSNTGQRLDGCYTDGDTANHPNQCAAGTVKIAVLESGVVNVDHPKDPFDGYVLQGPVAPHLDYLTGTLDDVHDTNQFRQIEANFSLFWGLAIHAWVQLLIPDNTPFDQFLDANPDAFMSLADTTEPLLVDDLLNCTTSTERFCFRENGPFKRDPGLSAFTDCTGEGGTGCIEHPNQGGTRNPATDPDPLLGADIFFASNLSLKNRNFRSGRCGACHNMPTLTDNTVPFTMKAMLPDFASEFSPTNPGVELLIEPLGRSRVISGFLLESEIAENGQDAIERRFINQSIAPNPNDGFAYPDGVFNPPDYIGAGQAFIDNGVYNLGVRPINEDIGRGGTDAFGWPLSLATLMLKNLGGPDFEPGNPIDDFNSSFGPDGGLFEHTAQDQLINPGVGGGPEDPKLPPYLAPWANEINVGDAAPDLDELNAGINTLTDVGMLEGFGDVIGPINPAAVKNENFNSAESELEGTWPEPNRVLRDGAFKAPQLRNVELTGPYFHNGGKLTLRQVVDFYTRGGDFPITNAAHRDFLLVNLNIEAQSNLNGAEKVALVDFLLQLTDERNRYDQAPFDHPQVIVPIDGTAPDNTLGRSALLSNPKFMNVPAVGSAGQATPEPAFLNVRSDDRNSPHCSASAGPVSHYCSAILP